MFVLKKKSLGRQVQCLWSRGHFCILYNIIKIMSPFGPKLTFQFASKVKSQTLHILTFSHTQSPSLEPFFLFLRLLLISLPLWGQYFYLYQHNPLSWASFPTENQELSCNLKFPSDSSPQPIKALLASQKCDIPVPILKGKRKGKQQKKAHISIQILIFELREQKLRISKLCALIFSSLKKNKNKYMW